MYVTVKCNGLKFKENDERYLRAQSSKKNFISNFSKSAKAYSFVERSKTHNLNLNHLHWIQCGICGNIIAIWRTYEAKQFWTVIYVLDSQNDIAASVYQNTAPRVIVSASTQGSLAGTSAKIFHGTAASSYSCITKQECNQSTVWWKT